MRVQCDISSIALEGPARFYVYICIYIYTHNISTINGILSYANFFINDLRAPLLNFIWKAKRALTDIILNLIQIHLVLDMPRYLRGKKKAH